METIVESAGLTMLSALLAWPIAVLALGLANTAFGAGAVETIDVRAFATAAAATAIGLAIGAAAIASRSIGSAMDVVSARLSNRMRPGSPSRWPAAVQAALSLVLIAIAVTAVRGYERVAAVPSGLAPAADSRVAVTVTLRGARFRDQSVVARYYDEVLAHVRQLPGVTAAGATAVLPLNGSGWTSFIWMPEYWVIVL